jgi:cell division septal protein FtsQ
MLDLKKASVERERVRKGKWMFPNVQEILAQLTNEYALVGLCVLCLFTVLPALRKRKVVSQGTVEHSRVTIDQDGEADEKTVTMGDIKRAEVVIKQ